MKYYRISENRLKQLIKLEKAVGEMSRYKGYFALPSVEITEDDLKEFEEFNENEEIKDEITDEITNIDIDIHNEKIPVVLEVTKVSKFEPNFDSLFEEDE